MRRSLLLSLVAVGTFAVLILLVSILSLSPVAAEPEDNHLPDLQISTWNIGGHARPGSVYVYGIYFVNQGEISATNVLITDTLPTDTTFAGDGSGYPADTNTPGLVVWDIGSLESGESNVIMVTIEVPESTITGSAVITANQVVISNDNGELNPDDNEASSEPVDVWEDDVEVGVDKWADPWDPAAGQEFNYHVQWCNNRGSAVGPVWLTETLPADTTLIEWHPAAWWQQLWTESYSDANQLVLSALGLPGDWCQEVIVRVEVDSSADPWEILINHAEISAEGDVDPENDIYWNDGVYVGTPRIDLAIEKYHYAGQLFPGGWIGYDIYPQNRGNTEVQATVTDTLPISTTFVDAYWQNHPEESITPTVQSDDLVIWDLGPYDVSANLVFHVVISIDDDFVVNAENPPTVVNSVLIGSDEIDATPDDNEATHEDFIYPAGPNLRTETLRDFDDKQWINYHLRFDNAGDTPVGPVSITNTIPVSTSWDGSWDIELDQGRTITAPNVSDSPLVWEIEYLNPGERGWLHFDVMVDDPWNRPFTYTSAAEITIPPGDVYPAHNSSVNDTFTGGELDYVELYLREDYSSGMWGNAIPNVPVTVTTPSGQFTAISEGDYCGGCWNIDDTGEIQPGDIITAEAGAAVIPVIFTVPDPLDAVADSNTDTVSGQIGGWQNRPLEIYGEWTGGYRQLVSNGSGNFVAAYYDIPRGGQGYIRFVEEVSYAQVILHKEFSSPDLILQVNYDHDWVEGNFEAGHTIWLTVTDSGGSVKGTAELESGQVPWWNECCGFSTNWRGWTSGQPDIVPGDWVFGRASNGFTSTVRIGTINGELNLNADTVFGTIDVPWEIGNSETLNGSCGVWEENGPGFDFTFDPDNGLYFCDFSQEWDLGYDQDVGVQYQEPEGDWVMNVFRESTPQLNIWKDSDRGHARPGGVFVYAIAYSNDGEGTAKNVVLTDTLPSGVSYAGDTLGITPTVDTSGDPEIVVWQLGDLEPYSSREFRLTISVPEDADTGQGIIGENCVDISTTSEGDDPGDNQACTNPVNVWLSEVDVGVDKWANPDDPAPGGQFIYNINWCSNRESAVGPVTLTDTLPVSTTLVEWRVQEWASYWNEVSANDHQLVLSAPGLPGGPCENIELLVEVDSQVPIGTQLENIVEVLAEGDADPENNIYIHTNNVGEDRPDLLVHKDVAGLVATAGGTANFSIYYENQGNVPANVTITDTFDSGLIFNQAHWGGGQPQENENLPPPTIDGDSLVWELGELPVNSAAWFHIIFDIDNEVSTGTVLENCATIGSGGADNWPDDNFDCDHFEVNDPGPNLRVSKWHDWNGPEWLNYGIRFQNIGTEVISDVWLIDTMPVNTTWDGGYDWQFDWDRLADEFQTGDQLGWMLSVLYPGDSGDVNFNVSLDDPWDRPRWYTNTVEIDVPPGEVTEEDNIYQDVAFTGGEIDSVDVNLNVIDGNIWGEAIPLAPITVTTPQGQFQGETGEADCNGCWYFDQIGPVLPGDSITVEVGAAIFPVTVEIPDPFSATADSTSNMVWGQIDHLDNEWVEVGLDGGPNFQVQTDDDGNYQATFYDLPRGAHGEVRYWQEINYAGVTIHRYWQAPDLILDVNYGHDWINVRTEENTQVDIELTNDSGITKDTASITTNEYGDANTDCSHWDSGNCPDIEPLDWVYGITENGYTTTVHVGTIAGDLDLDNDSITVTVDATWFEDDLVAQCQIWEDDAPSEDFIIYPDGNESHTCNFSGQWDIQPGQQVAVLYYEPDLNSVGNVFQGPAPDLQLDKWTPSDGNPAEGSNFEFVIEFRNQGDAPANNVTLTDTLQGMTYIEDTSGVSHAGGGSGPIVWDFGTVEPGETVNFWIFVQIDSAQGEIITNSAQLATSDEFEQGDPGELAAYWEGQVAENDTQLNIGKWSWTGDPAAGTNIVFSINACNNGSTGSSGVTITDTLHPSLTVQSAWFQHPGWSVASSNDHEIIFTRPTLSAWWCNEIYLEAYVDPAADYGIYLSNTAVIETGNDLSPGDDVGFWESSVHDPHTNLSIYKNFAWGSLVPGGQIAYWISFQNDGNVPVDVPVYITDTLPANTVFEEAWIHQHYGSEPFTPIFAGADYVVWELPDGLSNGYGENFELVLSIEDNAVVGSILTNTVEISPQPDEDSFEDNEAIWVEEIYPEGANLRVRKDGQWQDEGQDTHWTNYWLTLENIGSERIDDLLLVDTLPNSMVFGDFDTNWDWLQEWGYDESSNVFTATYEYLNPGNTFYLNFWAFVTDTLPLPFGQIYTNTAELPLNGDVNPEDNFDMKLLTTGPDLYVEKALESGDLLPGELITFSIIFGNDGYGLGLWSTQGEVSLTDVLPEELEYVEARQQNCGWCVITPTVAGTDYIWNVGPLNAGYQDELLLAVQITDTATGLDTYTNLVEIASNQPLIDTEAYYENNSDSLDVTIALPAFVVGKNYASSSPGDPVAGTRISYTLEVENIGSSSGTNVNLVDEIPEGLTQILHDGAYDGSTISWEFADIAPGGSAGGYFSGIVACTAGLDVTNDSYSVVSSSEGVISAVGPPVDFTTREPSIEIQAAASQVAVLEGTTVTFTVSGSTDGTDLTYEWNFDDDGATAEGSTVSHTFNNEGTYSTVVTASDECGFIETAEIEISVERGTFNLYMPLAINSRD